MDREKRFPEKRRSIGVLTDWFNSQCHASIIHGAFACAREKGVDIFCFEGGAINSNRDYEAQRNMIYDYVGEENVDGLVVLSAIIGHFSTREQVAEFCRKFGDLPLVSVTMELEGIPTIMADNASGLQELLEHLIKKHEYKKFAFISGPEDNQDSMERLATFRDTLEKHGLVFNPGLVVAGDFTLEGGEAAVRRLLAENAVEEIDVIVAANDNMALGALKELRERGIPVPEEISVVGFDDLEEGGYSSPTLTTVNQPLYEQGWLAVETLLALLDGREVPPKIVVPTKPVFRESCGCFSEAVITAGEGVNPNGNKGCATTVAPGKEGSNPEAAAGLLGSTAASQGGKKELKEELAQLLVVLEEQGIPADNRSFLQKISTLLQEALWADEDLLSWQTLLSRLRRQLLANGIDHGVYLEVENLYHQLRVMIAEKAALKERIKYRQLIHTEEALDRLRMEILLASELNWLINILAERLPELGITSCYISEFCGDRTGDGNELRLLLGYNAQERIRIEPERPVVFSARELLPPSAKISGKPHAFIVVPLWFEQTPYGIALFEYASPDSALHTSLPRMLHNALQGVFMAKRLKSQEMELVIQREHLRSLNEMRRIIEGFIETISLAVEKRDPYTAGHQKRVAHLAWAIAKEMGLPAEEVEAVRMAGMVHDLGKIFVPAEILNKPGRLHELEFSLIKTHPQMGYEILQGVDFPWPLADIVRQHHERLDGSGYPSGMKDEEILPAAKILAVADVVEAMASHRPYRPALSIGEALAEIEKNRGVLYEPEAVDACLRLFASGYRF